MTSCFIVYWDPSFHILKFDLGIRHKYSSVLLALLGCVRTYVGEDGDVYWW